MNNYNTPGNYYCSNNDTATTLLNCPFSSAFILKVEYGTGMSYPAQTFTELYSRRIATRYRGQSEGSWQPYAYFSDDETIYDNLSVFGSLTQAYISKVNVTLQKGTASIEDSRIHPTSIVFAQADYAPSNIGAITCCAQPMHGKVNVYIRSANNGALPEDEATVTVNLIVLNKTL